MNFIDFIYQFNATQLITVFLVLTGVILLIISIAIVSKFSKTLKLNEYNTAIWRTISILIIGFIIGYSMHFLDVFEVYKLPIDPLLLVSLIYFFGAIFVFIAMKSTDSLLKSILGEIISNEKAYEIFLDKVDLQEKELEHLYDNFHIHCKHCQSTVSFNVADVVRQNYNHVDKGVYIETTFGVNSVLLRPTHKCKDGRREIVTVHDITLAYRSIDNSRIILGSTL